MKAAAVKIKRRRKQTPGPKPSITLQVVKRVSERVARGSTLELALAAEASAQINVESWKKALQRHPELSPHYEAAKGQFLDYAMARLAGSLELANLRWLLERRYPELFKKQDAQTVVNVSQTVGIPEDIIKRAREIQQEESKG